MGRAARRSALALILALMGAPAAAEPVVTVLKLPFAASEFRGPGSRVAAVIATTDALREDRSLAGRPLVVVWGAGGGAVLVGEGDGIRVVPLRGGTGDLARIEAGRGAIPSARLAVSGPLSVALTGPTRRYPRDALGSGVHAEALSIVERRPVPPGGGAARVPVEAETVAAGPDAVFEDREPRLADLDGDGTPEIVTVRSTLKAGSALAVLARRDGHWRIVAETPPTGEAARWLNPAAIADVLGTGRPQVALVRTPHLDGVLQLWSFEAGRLELKAERAGYANHAFGQTGQDLAAAIDRTGNGRLDLALPSLDRRAIALVSFRGGVSETARIPLPARVATGLAALGTGAGLHILAGLEDGRVVDVRP